MTEKSTLRKLLLCLSLNLLCPWGATADEKPFVIVVPSYNNKDGYQKNLNSIFCQKYENYKVIYIADAPTDGTDRYVEDYLEKHPSRWRLDLLKNQTRRGLLACMCRSVFSCDKNEIIVELDGSDEFATDQVLSHLNTIFTDPDVWMTYGESNNEIRKAAGKVKHPRAFYAALFQEIEKSDLQDKDSFLEEAGELAYVAPLLEMSDSHTRHISEPPYLFNWTFPTSNHREKNPLAGIDFSISHEKKYLPLANLPTTAITLPTSIYRQIKDINHPALRDYRFVQSYLANGKRDNLTRLGNVQAKMRSMKIIGTSSDQVPSSGSIPVNCDLSSKENCVIIYSTFNRNYPDGLNRLVKHIEESDFKGHVLYRIGGWPNEEGGSLVLAHVPYAFKPSFFKEAQRLGFKRVLWLDSAVIPLVSLNEIFSMIEEKGYFVMGNSHMIGPYMTKQAATYFGLTLAQTQQIPSCSAGLVGLDLTQEKPKQLLDLWYRAAFDKDAYFSPKSDQNALSMLLYQFNFSDLTPMNRMPCAETNDPIKPDSLFYLDRLCVQ